MLKNIKKRNEGFTIIEVLIVLAIAGLILLVVFLAVPALQRNSRNTQRKSDVQNMLGALNEYTNNNSGVLPKDQATLNTALDNGKYGFYNATSPVATYHAGSFTNPNNDTVHVVFGAKCNNGDATNAGASPRQVAVLYSVESSSGLQKACQES